MNFKKSLTAALIVLLVSAFVFSVYSVQYEFSYNHVSQNSSKEYLLEKIDPSNKAPVYVVAALTNSNPINTLKYRYLLWTSKSADSETIDEIISYLQSNGQGKIKGITRDNLLTSSGNGYSWRPAVKDFYSVTFYKSRLIFTDTKLWSQFAYGIYSAEGIVTESSVPTLPIIPNTNPNDFPTDNPSQTPTVATTANEAPTPSETSTQAPPETSAQTPPETSTQAPPETSTQAPSETSVQEPTEITTQEPPETPTEEVTQSPSETASDDLTEQEEENPIQENGGMPTDSLSTDSDPQNPSESDGSPSTGSAELTAAALIFTISSTAALMTWAFGTGRKRKK